MIQTIKVINPSNNQTLIFAGFDYYISLFGYTTPRDEQSNADNFNVYKLVGRTLKGFYALPRNQNATITGIDQDGSDFQSNRYQVRQLFFNFKQFSGKNMIYQNNTLYQKDQLLKIEVTTLSGLFKIDAAMVGNNETGAIELECPYPFFTTTNIKSGAKLIVENPEFLPLIPFRLPRILFGNVDGFNVLEINSNFEAFPIFRVIGTFTNLVVRDILRGTILDIQANVVGTLTIDTRLLTVKDASIDITNQTNGIFPTLLGGNNMYEFTFQSQTGDVLVEYEYNEVVSGIF